MDSGLINGEDGNCAHKKITLTAVGHVNKTT